MSWNCLADLNSCCQDWPFEHLLEIAQSARVILPKSIWNCPSEFAPATPSTSWISVLLVVVRMRDPIYSCAQISHLIWVATQQHLSLSLPQLNFCVSSYVSHVTRLGLHICTPNLYHFSKKFNIAHMNIDHPNLRQKYKNIDITTQCPTQKQQNIKSIQIKYSSGYKLINALQY